MKALDLQLDHFRLFQTSRVLTDVRPVFSTRSPSEIAGALVYHTLKIEYFEGQDTKEFFIALDDRDVASLIEALKRATTKAKSLRELLLKPAAMNDFGTTLEDGQE